MKSILIIAIASILLISCKKEYTCQCIIEPPVALNFIPTIYQDTIIIDSKQNEAKNTCESLNQEYSTSQYLSDQLNSRKKTCTLK
jgi:uncharacterized lipoprotein YajG